MELVYTQTNRIGSYLEVRPRLSSAILCLVLDHGLHHFANSLTERSGSAKGAPAHLYVNYSICKYTLIKGCIRIRNMKRMANNLFYGQRIVLLNATRRRSPRRAYGLRAS